MSADAGWYEIWADEGLDPPYLLIVRSTGGGHVEVLDTRDGHRVVHVADSRRAVRSGNRPTPKQDNPDAQLGPHRGQANRATGEGVNRAPVTEKAANEFAAFVLLWAGWTGLESEPASASMWIRVERRRWVRGVARSRVVRWVESCGGKWILGVTASQL